MVKKWLEKESQHVLSGHIFRYHKKRRHSSQSDKEGNFDVIECFPWVNVLAFDEAGKLILVEQYRHGVDDLTLEIPGGAVNPGEDIKASAQRELLEETGYSSDEWHFIGSVQANPAFMTNDCTTYLAMNCKKISNQKLDPMEEIDIHLETPESFERKIKSGEIKHSLVIAAYALYSLWKKA